MKLASYAVLSVVLLSLSCSGSNNSQSASDSALSGQAEDLWGSAINLDTLKAGPVIIEAFSPSNCGWCLMDGEFYEANYIRRAGKLGGHAFYLSPFNPQIDNYTFLKHYRNWHTPLLSYPPTLRRYQKTGFPCVIAFRDGQMVYSGVANPYDKVAKKLTSLLWDRGDTLPVELGTSFRFSDQMVWNTDTMDLVEVLPDGLDSARLAAIIAKNDRPGITFVRESDLSGPLLKKHLLFSIMRLSRFDFGFLRGMKTPFSIDSGVVTFGAYRFPLDSVSLWAAFPNPYNPERYVVLQGYCGYVDNWTDFAVWLPDSAFESADLLLDGQFAKPAHDVWRFADSMAVAYRNLKDFCKGGVCPIPVEKPAAKAALQQEISEPRSTSCGSLTTFGHSPARFPSICAGNDGVAVAWEEGGDVWVMAQSQDGTSETYAVENSLADAYNAKIVWDGSAYAVAYLGSENYYYRMYLRYLDGQNLSSPALVSTLSALDVISPAVASDRRGSITAAWTEWKANYRFPMFRIISNRILGGIENIRAVAAGPGNDYMNAWHASLVMPSKSSTLGAWNQHYPYTLCVAAGNLRDSATLVTQTDQPSEEAELGGYPTMVLDSAKHIWTFWQSGGFRTASGQAQTIHASMTDSINGPWGVPFTLSIDSQTYLNETPRAAVNSRGSISVVWAGRPKDGGNWGIYLSQFGNDQWSRPELISPVGVTCRAPDIAIDNRDQIWVAWHAGIGEQMVIQLLKYSAVAE